MATTGIDGLISGLDTTSLINSLMTAEAAPQTLLKTSLATTNSFVTALQSLNAKVASLATSATAAALPASWGALTATSSATSVTATASSSAQTSSLSFTVDHVASAQSSVSASVTSLAALFGGTVPTSITIAHGNGAAATVSVVDLTGVTTMASFASAINKATGAGVTATVVTVSPTQSRLQVTGSATGAASTFDLYSGTVTQADVRAGTAPTAVMARADALTTASDASITLWAGTPAVQSITSASNTFSNVLTGVNLTVSALEASPVTLTVARDGTALAKLASDLVGSLGVVLGEVTSQSATTTATAADGTNTVTPGVFTGDSAARALQQALVNAASYPVNGVSPSTVGINIAKDGTFTFDAAAFATALAADPANVQSIVTSLAARVQTVASAASDPLTGTLTQKITGQQSLATSESNGVADWDTRLAMERAGLEKTYADLEVSLSNLKSQSDWLTAQFASLSSSTSTTG